MRVEAVIKSAQLLGKTNGSPPRRWTGLEHFYGAERDERVHLSHSAATKGSWIVDSMKMLLLEVLLIKNTFKCP